MLHSFIDNLLSWFRKDDRFLVVEITPKGIRATEALANFKEKTIKIFAPHDYRGLADFKKRGRILENTKIVLSLSHEFATTVYETLFFARENKSNAINEAELDNIVSDAVWKVFDGSRKPASVTMSVGEADVVLGDINVWDASLDGRKVLNPLGFSGKKIEMLISETLIPKEVFIALKSVFPMELVRLLSESSASIARVTRAAVAKKEQFLFSHVGDKITSFTMSRGGNISRYDSFGWGTDDVDSGLSREFLSDQKLADSVVASYYNKKGSPFFLEKAGHLIGKEYKLFSHGLNRVFAGVNANSLYVYASRTIPDFVFNLPIRNKIGRIVKIFPVGEKLISDNFGFAVKYEVGAKEILGDNVLFYILDAYLAPPASLMDLIGKKRMRWLSGDK